MVLQWFNQPLTIVRLLSKLLLELTEKRLWDMVHKVILTLTEDKMTWSSSKTSARRSKLRVVNLLFRYQMETYRKISAMPILWIRDQCIDDLRLILILYHLLVTLNFFLAATPKTMSKHSMIKSKYPNCLNATDWHKKFMMCLPGEGTIIQNDIKQENQIIHQASMLRQTRISMIQVQCLNKARPKMYQHTWATGSALRIILICCLAG